MKIQTLFDVFTLSFSKVYPPASWNPITNEFNGVILEKHVEAIENFPVESNQVKDYYQHPITMGTSLLGLSNPSPLGEKQTWGNIWGNLLSIQNLFIPLTLPLNVIKLFTELLPCFLADSLENIANLAYENMENSRLATHGRPSKSIVINAILYVGCTSLRLLIEPLHFIGRAITSPMKGVEAAFHTALQFQTSSDESDTLYMLRNVAGIVLALISLGITITTYTILLPLLVTSGAAMMGAEISVNLPLLSGLLDSLGLAVSPATALLAGIGGLAGAFLTLIGTPIGKGCEAIRHWYWNRNHPASIEHENPVNATEVRTSNNPVQHYNPFEPTQNYNPFVTFQPSQPEPDVEPQNHINNSPRDFQ